MDPHHVFSAFHVLQSLGPKETEKWLPCKRQNAIYCHCVPLLQCKVASPVYLFHNPISQLCAKLEIWTLKKQK